DGSQATPPAPSDATAYVPLQQVTTQRYSPAQNLRPVQQAILHGDKTRAFWFRPAVRADFAVFQSSPPALPDAFGVTQLPQPQKVELLTQPANLDLMPIPSWGLSAAQEAFVIETSRSMTDSIRPGSWLSMQFDPGVLPNGARSLLLLVS